MNSIKSYLFRKSIQIFAGKKQYKTPNEVLENILKDNKNHIYQLPEKINKRIIIEEMSGFQIPMYHLGEQKEESRKIRILYFHGGAYVQQPSIEHWKFLNRIQKITNMEIFVPLYRKPPEFQAKNILDQMLDVYKQLCEQDDTVSWIFAGDSSGGGMALAFSQMIKEKDMRQAKKLVLISPWLDISLQNPDITNDLEKKDIVLDRTFLKSAGKRYAGEISEMDYRVSPLNGSLKGLPPIHVWIGTYDIFMPDNQKLKKMALKENVKCTCREYPKMLHTFPLFPIPEAETAIKEISNTMMEEEI